MQGKVLIFAAPSGAGKSTIVHHLLQQFPQLGFSVSACTRPPRPHEIDGQHYYFLTVEEFKEKIEQIELVEWQEVYKNSFYGTLKTEVERLWQAGKHIIFDVDVQGAIHLKTYFRARALAIFVAVPSLEILAERLSNRATETPESLKKRLAKAEFEMTFQEQFDVVLLNEDLAHTLEKATNIVGDFLRAES
jgi:guanylate kinase